jgi:hypothetical protein
MTTYTATITTGAEDLAGNALEADYVWGFTTGGKIELSHDIVTVPEGELKDIGVKLSDPPPVAQSILVLVLVSGDKDISVQSGDTMIFNYSNWDTYQYFQLAAAEDKDFLNGTAYIVVMAEPDYYASEDITAKEEDNDNELRLAVEAKASKFNYVNPGDELHDEFNGEVPLTIDCGIGGLGTVKGTGILDYNGSGYSPGSESYGSCTYDIVGVAHIFVDGDVNCSEEFSLDLNLEVQTDYIFYTTCPEENITDSNPNIDEYEGHVNLNPQNDYVYEFEETWEEGNVYGTDYLRVELLPM